MKLTLMFLGEGPLTRPTADVYAELLEQVALAESLGFDAVWFAEHHFTFHNGHVPNPLLMALGTAGRFTRINVGTSVVCLPLHNPLDIAEQAAMIDVLTGGRLMVGVGSGSSPMEFATLGIPMEERHQRFREGIDVLLHAWSGEPFAYEGLALHIAPTTVLPRPIQAPRSLLWVAASSERSSAVAGEVGCPLMLPRGRTSASYRPALEAHRDSLRQHGYDPATVPQAIARVVYVGESDEAAKRETEDVVFSFYRRFNLQGKPPDGPMPSYDDLVIQLNMSIGSAETVRDQLVAFGQETGITHLAIQPTWEQLDHQLSLASLRRFGEQVLPALV